MPLGEMKAFFLLIKYLLLSKVRAATYGGPGINTGMSLIFGSLTVETVKRQTILSQGVEASRPRDKENTLLQRDDRKLQIRVVPLTGVDNVVPRVDGWDTGECRSLGIWFHVYDMPC